MGAGRALPHPVAEVALQRRFPLRQVYFHALR
jgi:hypothetical protein